MQPNPCNLNMNEIDLEKLKQPSPLFRIFEPTQDKFRKLARELMMKEFFLPDEYRNWSNINSMLRNYTNPYIARLLYEVRDYSGLIGFTNIMPNYKAEFLFKIWDYDKIWSKSFARETKDLIDFIIDSFKLKRLEFASGDEKAIKMGKIAGFIVEGIKKDAFLHRGKFYDSYILAKYGG